MRTLIIFILIVLLSSHAFAETQAVQRVQVDPLTGGVSVNTVSLNSLEWVTAPTVEMVGRKSLCIYNPSESDTIYYSDVSGSTAKGSIAPQHSVTLGISNKIHIYVTSNSVTTFEAIEAR